MMIYPFNVVQNLIKDCERLIKGEIQCFGCFIHEFDFVEGYLEGKEIPFTSSLDNPEEVLVERLCQHCGECGFTPLDFDTGWGISAANDGWNCTCNSCGKLTK